MEKENKNLIKKKQDLFFGIIVAIITGLIVGIVGNMLYDLFFTHDKKFSDYNTNAVALLMLSIIIVEAFLEFLIVDTYAEDDIYQKSFWKRFSDFSTKHHWAGVFSGKLNGCFTSLIKWSFLSFFMYILYSLNIIIFITVAIEILLFQLHKAGYLKLDFKKTNV